MSKGCVVCGKGESSEFPLIRCDKCGMLAHEECMGIDGLSPEQDSFMCAYCESNTNEKCIVCNKTNQFHQGMLPTTDGHWVHALCALFSPGVQFPEATRMSGPIDLSGVTLTSGKCRFCQGSVGLVVPCEHLDENDVKSCKQMVHAICAWGARCVMTDGGVRLLCRDHKADVDVQEPFPTVVRFDKTDAGWPEPEPVVQYTEIETPVVEVEARKKAVKKKAKPESDKGAKRARDDGPSDVDIVPLDEVCDVCLDEETTEDDAIVFCDGPGCDLAVHASCGSVPPEQVQSDDDWYCPACLARGNIKGADPASVKPPFECPMCPCTNGAMAQVDDRSAKALRTEGNDGPIFAHIICSRECSRAYSNGDYNVGKGQGVARRIRVFRKTRGRVPCAVCGHTSGCVVPCSGTGCTCHVHQTCADRAGCIKRAHGGKFEQYCPTCSARAYLQLRPELLVGWGPRDTAFLDRAPSGSMVTGLGLDPKTQLGYSKRYRGPSLMLATLLAAIRSSRDYADLEERQSRRGATATRSVQRLVQPAAAVLTSKVQRISWASTIATLDGKALHISGNDLLLPTGITRTARLMVEPLGMSSLLQIGLSAVEFEIELRLAGVLAFTADQGSPELPVPAQFSTIADMTAPVGYVARAHGFLWVFVFPSSMPQLSPQPPVPNTVFLVYKRDPLLNAALLGGSPSSDIAGRTVSIPTDHPTSPETHRLIQAVEHVGAFPIVYNCVELATPPQSAAILVLQSELWSQSMAELRRDPGQWRTPMYLMPPDNWNALTVIKTTAELSVVFPPRIAVRGGQPPSHPALTVTESSEVDEKQARRWVELDGAEPRAPWESMSATALDDVLKGVE
ncbi:PHD-zinc-finger like domain [Carpediemonas membranifera]|uniref:PHD-zinc-finger like domain n=1 Tax=Carpediemonas membranifera TaxID=201153 RepID=A0A8J6APY0_9EUKA|nr:PHD-zinc-finger like domain [Carpediemonas membranifera]|eukprot:KAG9390208.1 PHD-zinc-finger like domain [Carpediemonas membranifera]